jgi:Flp pilus assembly protein TadG
LEEDKLLRDVRGSVLVESTFVIPIFLLLVLGTIDVTYMFFEWVLANKAVYVGARAAAVLTPVASDTVDLKYTAAQLANAGLPCFTVSCPSISPAIVCTSTGCKQGGAAAGFTSAAFTNVNKTGIFDQMKRTFPRLQPENVTISYETNGSGFAGQPWSGSPNPLNPQFTLPMNVKVQIQCMTHQLYFLSGLMQWVFSAPTDAQGQPCSPVPPQGMPIPAFATTMQSEDTYTD